MGEPETAAFRHCLLPPDHASGAHPIVEGDHVKKYIVASFVAITSLLGTVAIANACPPGFFACNVCTQTDGNGVCTRTVRACCSV